MTSQVSPNESLPLLSTTPQPQRRRRWGIAVPHALEFLNVMNEIAPDVRWTAQSIFAIALLTNIMFMTFVPIKFLYFKYLGFVSDDGSDISFYVYMLVLESFIPFLGHAMTGYITSRIGARNSFVLLSLCAVSGILLIIQASAFNYRATFAAGWVLLRLANSIQVVRVIVLAESVPPRERTTVMAIHEIWGPLGCIVGPLVWIVCSWVAPINDIPVFGLFRFGQYTLTCIFMTGIAVAIGLISWFGLRNYHPPTRERVGDDSVGAAKKEKLVGPDFVSMCLNDGGNVVVNTKQYQMRTFAFFATLIFSVNCLMGLIRVSFQPILIDHFHITGAHLGLIFEAIYLFAFIPQFLLAYLSRILPDRSILLIGLILKLAGFALCFPYFNNRVYVWQAVCGYLLIVQASRFFRTASLSLASKLLGPMSNGTLLGMLSSASQIGPAIAQLFFAQLTLDLFGTYYYVFIGIPGIIAITMVVLPASWKSLDPTREFCQLLFKHYKREQHKSKRSQHIRRSI